MLADYLPLIKKFKEFIANFQTVNKIMILFYDDSDGCYVATIFQNILTKHIKKSNSLKKLKNQFITPENINVMITKIVINLKYKFKPDYFIMLDLPFDEDIISIYNLLEGNNFKMTMYIHYIQNNKVNFINMRK